MKTLVALAVLAFCVYYYMDTHKQLPALPPPPEAVVAAAPKPAPRKVYYHSPLDAPAMRTGTGTHSGTGYVSKNQGTNWRGTHLADGAAPHGVVQDTPPDDESESPR